MTETTAWIALYGLDPTQPVWIERGSLKRNTLFSYDGDSITFAPTGTWVADSQGRIAEVYRPLGLPELETLLEVEQ